MQREQQRAQNHRAGHHQHEELGDAALHDAEKRGEAEQHECKFAAGRQTERQPTAGALRSPESRPIARRTATLISMNPKVTPIRVSGISRTSCEIGRHSDRDEEQAEEQSLERLDVGLEFVAEFAVREQYAGQEGAQRQGQAHLAHEQRRGDDDQQAGCREGLGDAGCGDDPQHGAQYIAAADHDGSEHREEFERQPAPGTGGSGRATPNKGNRASAGSTAMSWNSRMLNAERPYWELSWPRSARSCRTRAVEDIERPKPMTNAAAFDCPKAKYAADAYRESGDHTCARPIRKCSCASPTGARAAARGR